MSGGHRAGGHPRSDRAPVRSGSVEHPPGEISSDLGCRPGLKVGTLRAFGVVLVVALTGCSTGSSNGPVDRLESTRGSSGAPPTATITTAGADRPTDASGGSPSTGGEGPGSVRAVTVTSITDGDTFRAGDERVRLIGVDTPEVSGDVECYGREATAALDRLIPPGTEVRLVADVEPVDRYGRTLSYVYRSDDGAFVNLALARDGFAQPLTIPPDVAHERDFVEAAAEARRAGRGLWSACADDVDPLPTTTPATTTSSAPGPPSTSGSAPSSGPVPPGDGDGAGDGCDPAYPDVCIPPAPPDLDCGDITFRDFTVLAPDPHRFDGGGDGTGCETR